MLSEITPLEVNFGPLVCACVRTREMEYAEERGQREAGRGEILWATQSWCHNNDQFLAADKSFLRTPLAIKSRNSNEDKHPAECGWRKTRTLPCDLLLYDPGWYIHFIPEGVDECP